MTENPGFNPKAIPTFNLDQIDWAALRKKKSIASHNQPPSVNQKEHMRRNFAEARLILHLASLVVKEQVTGFIFSEDCIPALSSHIESESKKLNFIEYSILVKLLTKAGVNVDLTHVQPTIFEKPIRVDHSLQLGIIAQFDNGNQYHIAASSYDSVRELLERDRFQEIIIFALFYFMDLDELIHVNRARGQSITRFLKVYASSDVNDMIYGKLEYFTRAMRLMTLNGTPLSDITMEMLVRNVDATIKANQGNQE